MPMCWCVGYGEKQSSSATSTTIYRRCGGAASYPSPITALRSNYCGSPSMHESANEIRLMIGVAPRSATSTLVVDGCADLESSLGFSVCSRHSVVWRGLQPRRCESRTCAG